MKIYKTEKDYRKLYPYLPKIVQGLGDTIDDLYNKGCSSMEYNAYQMSLENELKSLVMSGIIDSEMAYIVSRYFNLDPSAHWERIEPQHVAMRRIERGNILKWIDSQKRNKKC